MYGGSFGNAFLNGVVSDAAAVGANGIGGSTGAFTPENIIGHALLGCAAAGLGGGDCASGAVGGATAASLASVLNSLDSVSGLSDKGNKALGAALAILASGFTAEAVGLNGVTAANAGANADLNNRQLHEDSKAKEKTLAKQLADKSNGQYTQAQLEDALRSANNKQLGETASTGAVVPYDAAAAFHIYDGTGMILGRAPDGTYVLMQDPAMLVPPSSDLQAFIKNNTGSTYSWNNAAPQLSAIPLSALPSIMNGTVTPEMLASRQNNVADFASWISTQSGRVSLAATAYGTYLASQPNAASQTGAAIQFGIAGTATVVGFGAGALEQLLRPNPRDYLSGSGIDIGDYFLSERFPLWSPAINEVSEAMKNLSQMQQLNQEKNE